MTRRKEGGIPPGGAVVEVAWISLPGCETRELAVVVGLCPVKDQTPLRHCDPSGPSKRWTDTEGAVIRTQSEEGPQGPREGWTWTCVDVWPVHHVIEGHISSFVVQEDAHPVKALFQGENLLWGGEGAVLVLKHLQGPEAVLRNQEGLPFPLNIVSTNPHSPHHHVFDFYLPVMSPWGIALQAQDTRPAIESLWVVRHALPGRAPSHTSPVLWQEELGMRGVWVQDHISCRGNLRFRPRIS